MNDSTKKDTRPDVGASERAKEPGQASRQGRASTSQFTTPAPTGARVHIADFLSRGEAHAVPLKYLKDLLHLNGRKIRLMIQRERSEGVPILESSNPLCGGYYLPGTSDERARCVRRLRERAREILRTARAIEEADI